MFRYTVATLAFVTLALPARADTPTTPSLSQRLSSLQRHWVGEDEPVEGAIRQSQHVEQGEPTSPPRGSSGNASFGPINQQPPRRSAGGLLSRDLFSALRGGEEKPGEAIPDDSAAPPKMAQPSAVPGGVPELRLAQATSPRAGSAFSGTTKAAPDLGTALAAPTHQPTPATSPTSTGNNASGRRPYASNANPGLDLITSSAGSKETKSSASESPRVALNSPATRANASGLPYATAADAAKALAGPNPAAALYDAEMPVTTGSPADIPPVTSPVLAPQTSRASERYSASPVTPMEEETTAAASEGSVEPTPSPQAFDSKNSSEHSPSELQPPWDTAGTNPMRSSSGRPEPTLATQRGEGRLLVEQSLPSVTTQVTGPSEILIGREANYQVTINNRGQATADTLIAEITVPQWAEVVHSKANAGTVRHAAADGLGTQLRWEIPALEAGANQVLDIALIPRSSQPLELGVSWRQSPTASTTRVVVQEPKLAMAISGPEEVFFGRPQPYRLTISNPGTGAAEKVVVQLMPPGGGQVVSSHRLDSLAPGEAKVVEVEITAREAGELSVSAIAMAEGGLRIEAAQAIFCRKPELQVDWRGPNRKFAGTEGTYFFRVRNPGTAAADQVEFEVALPAGFQFSSASDGHRHDEVTRRVAWRVGTLRPGDDCYLELRGVLNQPGNNSLVLSASTPGGDIHHSGTALTEVVALADLKLEVTDPKGPVAVGTQIDYEIVVNNRGLSPAEEVQIAGFFSAGVEPLAVDGSEAQIADGRVSIRPIASLAPGQQVRIKIRAKGLTAGTHLFRAEVLCRDSEIKLAAEETTRYFTDDSPQSSGDTPHDSASRERHFQQLR
jgi:uncharacterized repeat protein (TIGR01451 family)